MLQPKKTKYRKAHKGRIKGVATSATTLNYGTYGLKALEAERVTARQIEAARVAMTRFMKRAGRVWVRIFPDVSVSKNNQDKIISRAKAKLEVDGEQIVCEGEGNGPVHALDNAIRKNVTKLEKYSEYLKDLKLVDYKVRILNTGTEATTRVSIESTDSQGKNWFTIGVSPNIIDASFKALIDSLDFKLFKDKAPASK